MRFTLAPSPVPWAKMATIITPAGQKWRDPCRRPPIHLPKADASKLPRKTWTVSSIRNKIPRPRLSAGCPQHHTLSRLRRFSVFWPAGRVRNRTLRALATISSLKFKPLASGGKNIKSKLVGHKRVCDENKRMLRSGHHC